MIMLNGHFEKANNGYAVSWNRMTGYDLILKKEPYILTPGIDLVQNITDFKLDEDEDLN